MEMVTLMRYLSMDESLTKNCSGFKELKSSDAWNTLQDHWNLYQKKHYAREGKPRNNMRQVTKMTGKQTCQMEM